MAEEFSTKELLIQLMTRVDSLNLSVQEQRILIERHMQSSLDRDGTIKELKVEVDTIKVDVANLKSLATKAATLWAIVVTVVGFMLNKFL